MKKRIIFTVLICVLALGFSYIYAHIDKKHEIYNSDTDTAEYIATGIIDERGIEQSFVCKESTLDGMSVKCQSFGDVGKIVLEYQLVAPDTDEVVAEGKIAGSELKNNQFNDLFFDEKVSGCRNKNYVLSIKVVDANEDNGIGFCYEKNAKKDMKLFIRDEIEEGTMIAKTITQKFDVETFIVVIGFLAFIGLFLKTLYKLFK